MTNYYKKAFCFNQYKTAKYYHKQDVVVPSALKLLLSRWTKLIDNDYLLFDTNNNPLSSFKLNPRLNKIFDGKISVYATFFFNASFRLILLCDFTV